MRRALNDTALLLRNSADLHEGHAIAVDVPRDRALVRGRRRADQADRLEPRHQRACARCPTAAACSLSGASEPASDGRRADRAGRRRRHSAGGARRPVPAVPRQLRQGQRPRPGHRPSHRDRLQRRDRGQLAAGRRHHSRGAPAGARGGDCHEHAHRDPRSGRGRPARRRASSSSTTSARCGSCWRSCCGAKATKCCSPRTAGAAIELLEREPVDLLISDIKMPDLSGVDVLRAAKTDRPGHPRHHDHRVRLDRDRRRGDAARRVRLPEQAVRRRSAQDEGAREDREPRSCGRRTCC